MYSVCFHGKVWFVFVQCTSKMHARVHVITNRTGLQQPSRSRGRLQIRTYLMRNLTGPEVWLGANLKSSLRIATVHPTSANIPWLEWIPCYFFQLTRNAYFFNKIFKSETGTFPWFVCINSNIHKKVCLLIIGWKSIKCSQNEIGTNTILK